jgi:hypothetical protein
LINLMEKLMNDLTFMINVLAGKIMKLNFTKFTNKIN